MLVFWKIVVKPIIAKSLAVWLHPELSTPLLTFGEYGSVDQCPCIDSDRF